MTAGLTALLTSLVSCLRTTTAAACLTAANADKPQAAKATGPDYTDVLNVANFQGWSWHWHRRISSAYIFAAACTPQSRLPIPTSCRWAGPCAVYKGPAWARFCVPGDSSAAACPSV